MSEVFLAESEVYDVSEVCYASEVLPSAELWYPFGKMMLSSINDVMRCINDVTAAL